VIAFTVAFVPTGIKTGVFTCPVFVVKTPALAEEFLSLFKI
jgi:hypothetical protein